MAWLLFHQSAQRYDLSRRKKELKLNISSVIEIFEASLSLLYDFLFHVGMSVFYYHFCLYSSLDKISGKVHVPVFTRSIIKDVRCLQMVCDALCCKVQLVLKTSNPKILPVPSCLLGKGRSESLWLPISLPDWQ